MAGVKISALPAVGAAQLTDIFPVVQAGTTFKETVSQLSTLISSTLTGTFVPLAGGTMTGPLILSQDPTLPLMAATKQYVDTIGAGFTVILAVRLATTANLTAVYANGAAGVGATLTNSGVQVALSIDGVAVALNDRILVKNQTTTFQNGVYVVTDIGSGATNWILTRSTDYDQAPAEVKPGTLVAVNFGATNATTSWLETATVLVMGTDPILFTQFTFSPTGFLLAANNLSDLTSVPTALINLGLGVPTGTGNVVLQTSPTLITPNIGAATASSLLFSPSTSGIIGTTTNDNASAGIVGEYISSTVLLGAAVLLTSNVSVNITTLALLAGDYDVQAELWLAGTPGAVITAIAGAINTVSATLPVVPGNGTSTALSGSVNYTAGVSIIPILPIGQCRISLAAPATVYFIANLIFSTQPVRAFGEISARRVR